MEAVEPDDVAEKRIRERTAAEKFVAPPDVAHLLRILDEVRDWEDVDDEWSAEIDAAHPTRGGSHEDYATAMRMVGHRHSKGELVTLVCWLLSKRK